MGNDGQNHGIEAGAAAGANDRRDQLKKRVRLMSGRVVSNKADKTITVEIVRRKKHSAGKYMNRSTKVHAHDPENRCREGDQVLIRESRPFSKLKVWQLDKVISK